MRAVFINSYGPGARVLRPVEDFAAPVPGAGELLVRVRAAGVNPIDCRVCEGYGRRIFVKRRGFEFPLIPGNDFSGEVGEVGSGVSACRPGDRVFGAPDPVGQGSYAEYRTVMAAQCVDMPPRLSFVEAAAIPYVAQTVWAALVGKAGLHPETAAGKRVLVHGGSGGVGSFAVQLLKAWDAFVATTCSAAKVAWVEQLGADRVIDYRGGDFSRELKDFDVVLDTVGGDNESLSLRILAPGRGHYVSLITPMLGNIDRHGLLVGALRSAAALMRAKRNARKRGLRYDWALFRADRQALEEVKTLVGQGRIKPVVDSVYPLERVAEAYRRLESGAVCGKVVLTT